jgi:Lamin Tail Domain
MSLAARLQRAARPGLGVLTTLCACSAAPRPADACEAALVVGDLVITEVFADPDGADEGREWFELYNATSAELELGGVTVTSARPDGSRARSHALSAAMIAAGGYLVLGSALPELAPAHVGYGYGAELGDLGNGEGGRLSLHCGGAEIDAVRYERVRSGRARAFDGGVTPDYVANDDAPQWCDSAMAFEAGGFGTPGQRNDDCEVVVPGRCHDASGARETVPAGPGDLVITELMPNPDQVDDAAGEWLEVWVTRELDLNGLGVDRLGDAAAPTVVGAEACLRVRAQSYAVLARSADPLKNGGLPRVDGPLPLSLVSGSSSSPGDVQLLAAGATPQGEPPALVDGVRWTRSTAGKSLQLDPDYRDAAANDEERVLCNGVAPYGAGDLGTPGEGNAECSISPPAGMCQEGNTFRGIDRPAPGQLVLTEVMANPAGIDSEQEWFELANIGGDPFDLNGLSIDRAGDSAPAAPILAATCKPVGAGGFAVLARHADPAKNSGLPRVDATYALSFGDAGALQVFDGATLLDGISWSNAPANASWQLDRAFTTASGNDLESRFCAATALYGSGANKGTPGSANARCP